jgi:hypothetical protein
VSYAESNGKNSSLRFKTFIFILLSLLFRYPRDVEVVVALPAIQSQNKKPEIHQHFYVSDEKRKRKHHKKDSQEEEEGERSGKLVKERVIIVDQDENSKFFFENDWLDGKCCVWCTSFGDTCCVFCCFPCYIYKLFHRSKVKCISRYMSIFKLLIRIIQISL